MKNIFKLFIFFNLLSSLPIFLLSNKPLAFQFFIIIAYFSILWVALLKLHEKLSFKQYDIVSSSFVLDIGLKFILSMFFIGGMIYFKVLTSIISILAFLVFYFIYTFLIIFYKQKS